MGNSRQGKNWMNPDGAMLFCWWDIGLVYVYIYTINIVVFWVPPYQLYSSIFF